WPPRRGIVWRAAAGGSHPLAPEFPLAVECETQPLAQVCEAGTESAATRSHAHSGVGDAHVSVIPPQAPVGLHPSPLLARIDAVAYGILDQRQQRHWRTQQLRGRVVDPQL